MKHVTSEATCVDRGFPLTILSGDCLEYKEAVVDMFRYSPLVQEALIPEEKQLELTDAIKTEEFTVLSKKSFPALDVVEALQWKFLDEAPVLRISLKTDLSIPHGQSNSLRWCMFQIKKCECNQMTDLNMLDDSTHDNILNILSKWHCMCGKKVLS